MLKGNSSVRTDGFAKIILSCLHLCDYLIYFGTMTVKLDFYLNIE